MSDFFTKGIYSSGMVLQRNTINCIFGSAAENADVKLFFRGETFSTKADSSGEWSIEYNPGAEGGPFELKLCSDGKEIVFSDIFVGEVWVLSGQSNAQLPMERMRFSYKDEFELDENPFVRMITVPISYSFDGEKDSVQNPQWICASPNTLGLMSGTGYFFAKKLFEDLKVPVGIINASQGGSPISAWMDEDSLSPFTVFDYLKRIEKWKAAGEIEKTKENAAVLQKRWDEEILKADKGNAGHWENTDFSDLDGSWTDFSVPGDYHGLSEGGIVWFKKEITLSKEQADLFSKKKTWLWLGTIVDADKAWVNGVFCGVTYYSYPPRRYVIPSGTLREGKNTVTIRVQKNGRSPLRFYEEKPYCIFTEDDFVPPVAFRNAEFQTEVIKSGAKIDLTGSWKMKKGCETGCAPGSCFFEWEPSALYNSMLAPCFKYAVAGVLWYQGESDAGIAVEYRALLVSMIGLWRYSFKYAVKNMPFVVMQLPNWADGYADEKKQNFGDWPQMRESQDSAARIVINAATVCMIDGGEWNDLHPEKKRTGGTRAAECALKLAYKKDYSATPRLDFCDNQGDTIKLRFDCDGSSLVAYKAEGGKVDFSQETQSVYGFALVTKEGEEVAAEAKLTDENEVLISVPTEKGPFVKLLYLWKNNPEVVNLYNAAKNPIPAIPFRIKL